MKLRIVLALSAIGAVSGIAATPAYAQATRTWVSGVGDDVNPCSRTAPCKTFAGAISKTSAGGEINCLDPGGYGTVTITKSITIDCTGTLGSVLSSATNGINVNDSASGFPGTIHVILRGLTINGSTSGAQNGTGNPGTGLTGINFTSGSSLVVEDVIIQDVNGGVAVAISFKPSNTAMLAVSNSVLADNGTGVLVQPVGANGNARVSLSNVEIVNNNGSGVSVNSTGNTGPSTQVMMRNVRLVRNGTGVNVLSPVGTTGLTVGVYDSDIFANTIGIRSDGGTIQVGVSDSTIQGNGTGLQTANGGTIQSFGRNRLAGNGVPGAFNPPALIEQ
jgi:hypothetical protein